MKKIIQILFVIGCVSVTAQNSLTGKITDINNEPLIGVDIYATEFHKGTVSDINGEFTLKNLPNGKVKISISYVGFETIIKTFNFQNKSINYNTHLI